MNTIEINNYVNNHEHRKKNNYPNTERQNAITQNAKTL